MADEISRLTRLPLRELKIAWQAEFRRAPPKGLWRDLLLRTLAWRIQEKAFGGHDKATLNFLEVYGQKRVGDQRAQRLKAGTVLIRDFGGVRHTVTILPGRPVPGLPVSGPEDKLSGAGSGQRRARSPTCRKMANSPGIPSSGLEMAGGRLWADTGLPLARAFHRGIDLPNLVQDFGRLASFSWGRKRP